MKRVVKLSLALVLAVLGTVVFIQCQKEKVLYEPKTNPKFNYGEIHNKTLDYMYSSFTAPVNFEKKSKLERINYVEGTILDYLTFIGYDAQNKSDIEYISHKYKYLLDNKYLVSSYLGMKSNFRTNGEGKLYNKLDSLVTLGIIDSSEYNLLLELSNAARMALLNEIDMLQFKEKVLEIQKLQSYSEFSGISSGKILSIVLDISMSSILWWEEHPEAGYVFSDSIAKVKALPAWAAADAAGAVIGAAGGAISSYVGSGEVNWGSVGTSAVLGAISGSTGLVGRVANFISGFF